MEIPVIAAVICTFFAAIEDLKTSKIPNRIVFPALAVSIVFGFFLWSPLIWAANFAGAFIVAYIFWRLGLWSGGDGKLFWLIVSFVPVYPMATTLSRSSFMPGFLMWLALLLITRFFFSSVLFRISNGDLSFVSVFMRPVLFALAGSLFGLGLYAITGIQTLMLLSLPVIIAISRTKHSFLLAFSHIVLGAAMLLSAGVFDIAYLPRMLLFGFVIGAWSVGRNEKMVAELSLKELKEGMQLAETITKEGRYEDDSLFALLKKKPEGYLAGPSPAGLSKKEILRLKKHGIKKVLVNVPVKLAPFMFIALILAVLYDGLLLIA